jgi:hypothetical protein
VVLLCRNFIRVLHGGPSITVHGTKGTSNRGWVPLLHDVL